MRSEDLRGLRAREIRDVVGVVEDAVVNLGREPTSVMRRTLGATVRRSIEKSQQYDETSEKVVEVIEGPIGNSRSKDPEPSRLQPVVVFFPRRSLLRTR